MDHDPGKSFGKSLLL